MLKQSLPYLIALAVLIMVFSLFGYPLFKKSNEADKLLAETIVKLEQIYSSENLPSKELVDSMQKDNEQLKEKYENLKAKLPVSKELTLPEGVNRPLFFLEEFKKVKERIKVKALERKVQILTEDFGLPNFLPSETEASQLIRSLYITEIIVNLLIDVGVKSIDVIELGAAQNANMYEDFPLNLGVKCDTSSLTNLLFTLENTDKGFFTIREFSLGSSISSITSSRTATGSNVTARRDYRSPVASVSEKNIQVDLSLSVIRWK
ncbi:Amuc_1100 family pilus-like protein [bacterium]|nr:Amuc_1100 family pilus-like protein [bacterium]